MASAHTNGVPSGDEPGFRVVTPLDEHIQHACTVAREGRGLIPSLASVRAILATPDTGPKWRQLYQSVRESKSPDYRTIVIEDWPKRQQNRPEFDRETFLAAMAAANALVDQYPDDPEPEPEERFTDYDLEEFLTQDFHANYLVEDVLVANQPCVIAAPLKSLKTSFSADLAVSIATGTPFLGRFDVPKAGRVLFVSAESGGAKLQATFLRILAQKGFVGEEARAEFRANLRTQLKIPRIVSPEDMEWLQQKLRSYRPDVLIYDPLYKGLSGGSEDIDHGNVFQMGAALGRITDICESAGTTLVVVHHFRKSIPPKEAPTLDHSAYAGIGEFARQWILLNRVAPYKPGSGYHPLRVSIGGSQDHQGEYLIEVNEGSKQDHDGQRWEVQVSDFDENAIPAGPSPFDRRIADKRATNDARDAVKAAKVAKAADAIVDHLKFGRKSKAKIEETLGLHPRDSGPALELAKQQGRIRECQVPAKNARSTRTVDGWELVPDEPTDFF